MGIFRAYTSVVVSSVLVAAPALAQPQPTEKQKAQAGELVKKAIAKSQGGDHAQAIELYKEAYKIVPNAILLSNIGSEFQQAGDPVQALNYFCKYLKDDPTGNVASYASAQAKTLQIQLNGSADEDDPCKPVVKAPPPPPPEPTPPTKPDTTSNEVTGTKDLSATASTSTSSGGGSGLKVAGLATAGVGVIGLAAGIYFGLQAKQHSDWITNYVKDHPNTPWMTPDGGSDIQGYEQEGQSDQTKQIIFTVGGGVVAATGVVLYVLGRNKGGDEHVAVRPFASPTSAGLAVGGGF